MDNDFVHIGNSAAGSSVFGLDAKSRAQHTYIVGQTGTGKSTLLRNMIIEDIAQGRGVGFIDVHGDEADEILNHIPPWRIEDVVYFNPADHKFPVGFNPFDDLEGRLKLLRKNEGDYEKPLFEIQTARPKDLIANEILVALRNSWATSWGARMNHILNTCILTLLECTEDTTMLGILRILNDTRYRNHILKQVKNPLVLNFWHNEFDRYSERNKTDWVVPIQDKVGFLLMSEQTRNVLGQKQRKIAPRYMMDNKSIFIANLSKGNLGEDQSKLLGSLLVSSFQAAAMSRSDLKENERENFFLYIDEFQNFTTESFAPMLSETRKFGLRLILSSQFTQQLTPETKNAVFGNVGNLISFRVGGFDSEVMYRAFGKEWPETHYCRLNDYEVCVKLKEGNQSKQPFNGHTFPPLENWHGLKRKIVERSREKYAVPKEVIERKIWRWMCDYIGLENENKHRIRERYRASKKEIDANIQRWVND